MAIQDVVLVERDAALVVSDIVGPDRDALRKAVEILEGPSLTARLSELAGKPIQMIGNVLPARASEIISQATSMALRQALTQVLKTVPRNNPDPQTRGHRILASVSGAIGGAFGMAAIPIELPISTTIMLRAIARIAQSEGEDLNDPAAALACLEVFALGGQGGSRHLHESGYFAVRAALAQSVVRVIRQVAERGMIDEGASAILRLLAQIGTRFGLTVSQKVAAQALPILGAVGGAAINAAFTAHFQSLAHGHFTVRRLERAYGQAKVRATYLQLQGELGL